MATAAQTGTAPREVQFGIFEADLQAGELRRSGVRIRLQSQPFKLLAALLEQPGEVVSREALQQRALGLGHDRRLRPQPGHRREQAARGSGRLTPRIRALLKRWPNAATVHRTVKTLDPQQLQRCAVETPAARHVASAPKVLGSSAGIGFLARWSAFAWRWRWFCFFARRSARLIASCRSPIPAMCYQQLNDLDVESFPVPPATARGIYFSHMDNGNPVLAVALAANGEISHFHLPSEIGAPLIGSLSPDGSKLIVHSHLQAEPEQPLWIVPTLGGDARRVPNVLAHDATWMPDGRRLLIANGNDLTIVGTDGSDPHKLITVAGSGLLAALVARRQAVCALPSATPSARPPSFGKSHADGSQSSSAPARLEPARLRVLRKLDLRRQGFRLPVLAQRHGHSEIWALRERPWFLQRSRAAANHQWPARL